MSRLSRRAPRSLTGTVLLLAALAATGCQAPLKRPDHIRAIWVTRMDYKTQDDVVQIIENCHWLGMNTVLFQVRGNGTAFYPSSYEPWAEQFDFQDPGYDPLAVAIQEAHQRGMLLEAYVNVMPAWRGREKPADATQLYCTHPEWFWYDKDGHRQPLVHTATDSKGRTRTRAWYVSLNPCLPEVRAYLVKVFREIVEKYPIDGLHLDYIRFPNEPVVAGEVIPDYPRDARTLALYKAATGLAPDDDPEHWGQWRTDQVSTLVREIHDMVQATRPGIPLTASVGTNPARSKKERFRDSMHWAKQGWLETAYVMNYKTDLGEFSAGIENWAHAPENVRVVQGIGAWQLRTPDALLSHVRTAEESNGHFCLFAYSAFFPSAEDPPVDANTDEATKKKVAERARLREMRRDTVRQHLWYEDAD